jgi:hypothetical protein
MTCLAPGDTLTVKAGTYTETSLTPPNGTAAAPVTIQAESPKAVTIQAPASGATDSIFALTDRPAAYLVIDGFILDGRASSEGDGAGKIITMNEPSHDVTFKNCEIRNGRTSGVNIHPVTNADFSGRFQFSDCEVHHNGYFYPGTPGDTNWHSGHGYYFGVSDGLIAGGSIHDNAGHGIQFYHNPSLSLGAPNRNIMRCVRVYNNGRGPEGGPGIGVYWGSGNQLLSNEVSGNRSGEIITTTGAVSLQTASGDSCDMSGPGPRPRTLPAPTRLRIGSR